MLGMIDKERKDMQVKKTVTVVVETTDGKEVKPGDKVYLKSNEGKILTGLFSGITERGLWKFVGFDRLSDVEFTIHPKGITSMYLAE